MAFIKVNQVADGSAQIGAQDSEQKIYIVESDSPVRNLTDVCRAPGIPQEGDGHPTDPSLRVNRVSARYASGNGNLKVFKVTVNYEVPDAAGGGGNSNSSSTNPLNDPPQISWSSVAYEETVIKDINGNTIQNSAGKPFSDPITRTRYRPVLTISRNSTRYREETSLLIGTRNRNTLNLGSGTPTIGAGKALLTEYSGQRVISGAYTYWQITVRVIIDNDDKWALKLADSGFFDKSGRRAIDEYQGASPTPLPLNGFGQFTDKAAIRSFDIIPLASWRF